MGDPAWTSQPPTFGTDPDAPTVPALRCLHCGATRLQIEEVRKRTPPGGIRSTHRLRCLTCRRDFVLWLQARDGAVYVVVEAGGTEGG